MAWDLGLTVTVPKSSTTRDGLSKVGDPPLTVALRCFVSMMTGRVNWGDSEPLRKTSLSVSLPSLLSSGDSLQSTEKKKNYLLEKENQKG